MRIQHADCPGHEIWQLGSIFECTYRAPEDLQGIEAADSYLALSLREARTAQNVELPSDSTLRFSTTLRVNTEHPAEYEANLTRLPEVWHWQCGRPGLYVKRARLRQVETRWVVDIEPGLRGDDIPIPND